MNIGQILQLISLTSSAITAIKDKPISGDSKKDEIKATILSSTDMVAAISRLDIVDQKAFHKYYDKMIDDMVGMFKACKWQ